MSPHHFGYSRMHRKNQDLGPRFLPIHLSNSEGPCASLGYMFDPKIWEKLNILMAKETESQNQYTTFPFTISKMTGQIHIQTNATSLLQSFDTLNIFKNNIFSDHLLQLIYAVTNPPCPKISTSSIVISSTSSQKLISSSTNLCCQCSQQSIGSINIHVHFLLFFELPPISWTHEIKKVQEQVVACLVPCPHYRIPWAAILKCV